MLPVVQSELVIAEATAGSSSFLRRKIKVMEGAVLLPSLKASYIIGRTLNQVKKSKYFKYYSDDNVDI